jgi:exodeoxyribonuclease V beta subunit
MKVFDAQNIPLEGVHLIEASAGTGKTYSIEGLYVRLIESGLRPDQILVVTFTEAATSELRDRIRSRLRKRHIELESGNEAEKTALVRSAVLAFDTSAIFTIHGFCRRMLYEMAFETGSAYSLELTPDQSGIALDTAWDFFRTTIYNQPPEYLEYAKPSPQQFLETARLAGFGTCVIPDIGRPDIETAISEFKDGFFMLSKAWEQERETFIGILESSPCLDKRKLYKKPYVAKAINNMDNFIDADFTTDIFKSFKYFRHSEMLNNAKLPITAPLHPFFELCDTYAQTKDRLDNAFDLMTIWLKKSFIEFFRQNMPLTKERLGVMHFDDLLIRMRQAIRTYSPGIKKAVREKFSVALIDEFQDTDPNQWDIFNSLFPEGPMYLIGDPKQAIYGFRGADIFTYLDAKDSIPEKNQHRLEKNRRSIKGLVRAVNRLFEKGPFGHPGIPYEKVDTSDKEAQTKLIGEPFRIWVMKSTPDQQITKADATYRAVSAVAAEAARLISSGEVKAFQIAVLTRKWRQANLVRDALNRIGLKCVITSDEKVFSSEEALLMRILMDATAEPAREDLIKACLATPLIGMSAEELSGLDDSTQIWDSIISEFAGYHEMWRDHGFMRMFREFYNNRAKLNLALLPGAERRLTNMQHIAELLHSAEVSGRTGIDSLLSWFNENTGHESGMDESELRLESDEDAIKIMTVHKSKGLQFPVVFVPFAWDETDNKSVVFNDGKRRVLDLGSANRDENDLKCREESRQEDMRLLYVALTRATDRCYLITGDIKMSENSALFELFKNEDISSYSSGDIRVETMPELSSDKTAEPAATSPLFASRIFRTDIDTSFAVMSYTSLSQGSYSDGRDIDSFISDRRENETALSGISAMPRGAATGNLLHEVMEMIDFQSPNTGLIEDIIKRHGFETMWLDAINTMVENVLSVEIEAGCRLGDVTRGKRLSELEFMLPVSELSGSRLKSILGTSGIDNDLTGILERLDIKPAHGFLRGFIDLVFETGGKYYLIDWKSNYLGAEPVDYGEASMKSEMTGEFYVLQYHIYTLALHRFLSSRVKDYSYEKHFGGLLYFFLRGIDGTARNGIYRARPDFRTVNALACGLLGEKENV